MGLADEARRQHRTPAQAEQDRRRRDVEEMWRQVESQVFQATRAGHRSTYVSVSVFIYGHAVEELVRRLEAEGFSSIAVTETQTDEGYVNVSFSW